MGHGPHWARAPARPAPTRKPTVSDMDARPGPASGRPSSTESSLIQVVPTAITKPRAAPQNTRPSASSAGESGPRARMSDPSRLSGAAGSIKGRRPYRSDRGPPASRAGMIPTTYAPRRTSTVTVEKCDTSRYMTSSGVNSLPPQATANMDPPTASHAPAHVEASRSRGVAAAGCAGPAPALARTTHSVVVAAGLGALIARPSRRTRVRGAGAGAAQWRTRRRRLPR